MHRAICFSPGSCFLRPAAIYTIMVALVGGAWLYGSDLSATAFGVKNQPGFSDDFDRADLGPELKSFILVFIVADGLFKGHQERADHGGALGAVLSLPNGNVILKYKFCFARTRSFNLSRDDAGFRGVHEGHIIRVTVRPDRIILYDDKEGAMRNDIYALHRSGDPQIKTEGDRMAEKTIEQFPVKLQPSRWYYVGLEIDGDRMRVTIDGQPAGHLQSSSLAHLTKSDLRLNV